MTRTRYPVFFVLVFVCAILVDSTFTTSATTAATIEATQVSIGGGQIMHFARIPSGIFLMGSPDKELFHQNNEIHHQVSIRKAFYMGQHEVTQAQYKQIMGTNPSFFAPTQTEYTSGYSNTDTHPVERVSWFDAVRFCNALSANQKLPPCYTNQKGRTMISDKDTVICNWRANGYRLPTEAEWEYACRGGTTTMYYWADDYDETQTKQYAWFYYNAYGNDWAEPHADKGGTQPVGMKPCNGFKLYDMSGNVWEWCWDWYGNYPLGSRADPRGTDSGSFRVLRGGAWINYYGALRPAFRSFNDPTYRKEDLGFRVCRSRP